MVKAAEGSSLAKAILLAVAVVAALDQAAIGQGVILWDESVNGELSQYYATATALQALGPGTNSVLGATEGAPSGNGWLHQDDYFTITVPAGLSLSAVYLTINRPNVWAWIGDPSYSTRLGWSSNPSTGDLLPQWGLTSVPAGSYGLYMANQDIGGAPSVADYRLDFVTQPTPEPGGPALLLFGLVIIQGWKFRHVRVDRSSLRRRP